MGGVDEVLEPILKQALTPEQISKRTGYSVEKVQKALDFMVHFGFIVKKGSKYKATRQGAALR